MKIAYLINSVEGGGAAFPVPDIVQVLQSRGHEVVIFALTPRDRLAAPNITAAGIRLEIREGGTKDHLAAYYWLARRLAAYQPDLVWTSLTRATLLGQLWARKHHIPTVHWQHSAHLKPANAFLLRRIRRWSHLWIADSQCVYDMARRRLGLSEKSLTCWPIFRADESHPVSAKWHEGKPIRIGTLGRLHPVKGYKTLIQAASLLKKNPEIPAFEVEIAGEGIEREELEAEILVSQAPVRLLGHVEDTKRFLKRLHIYMQPSLWEGFCLAAHEAMLSGLPVIATPAGEIPHSVTPETGIIIPKLDAQHLADAMAQLMLRAETLHDMGQKARERVLARFGTAIFNAKGHAILQGIEDWMSLRA